MPQQFIKLTNAKEPPSVAETWVNLALVTRMSRTARGTTVLNFAGLMQDTRGMPYVDRLEVTERLEVILKHLEDREATPVKPRDRRKATLAKGVPARNENGHQPE